VPGPRSDRVPAGLLVLVAIASVQVGSAVARTLFDELGAAGVTLLRLAIAALVLLALLRPPVRRWSRQRRAAYGEAGNRAAAGGVGACGSPAPKATGSLAPPARRSRPGRP